MGIVSTTFPNKATKSIIILFMCPCHLHGHLSAGSLQFQQLGGSLRLHLDDLNDITICRLNLGTFPQVLQINMPMWAVITRMW